MYLFSFEQSHFDAANSFSQKGWTGMIWAAWYGHMDCVRLLIEAGADKEARTTRVRGIWQAVFQNLRVLYSNGSI
jgi:ankyrin repeat protein